MILFLKKNEYLLCRSVVNFWFLIILLQNIWNYPVYEVIFVQIVQYTITQHTIPFIKPFISISDSIAYKSQGIALKSHCIKIAYHNIVKDMHGMTAPHFFSLSLETSHLLKASCIVCPTFHHRLTVLNKNTHTCCKNRKKGRYPKYFH